MNQKIYNETLQACLAGGMTDDAAHEYATDKATREPSREELTSDGFAWAGNTTDETAKAEITRDYQNQGFEIRWSKSDFTLAYYIRKAAKPLFQPLTSPKKFPLPIGYTYEPGNGTRFDVFMADKFGAVIVCLLNFGTCYVFSHAPHASYVAEKLRLPYGDAEEIAKLIAVQLAHPEDCGCRACVETATHYPVKS